MRGLNIAAIHNGIYDKLTDAIWRQLVNILSVNTFQTTAQTDISQNKYQSIVHLFPKALCAAMAGCGSDAPDSSNSNQASAQGGQSSSEASQKPQEVTNVKWVCLGEDQQNADPVYEKVNQLLGERYGLALDFETYPAGTYDEKMNMKINSGEEYDLCYTSQSWLNKYPVQVSKGAFLALDEYLDSFPKLTEGLPDFLFEQARIDGKVYAVPNYQICYSSWGFMFQKSIVEEMKTAGIDWDYTQIEKFWDAEHKIYMDALLSKEEQLEMNSVSWVDGVNNRKLLEDGYVRPDIATVQDGSADMAAGRYASVSGVVKPGGEAEQQLKTGGIKWVSVPVQVPFIEAIASRSTMTAVSSKSKQPEAALRMIEVMNTDKEIFNF